MTCHVSPINSSKLQIHWEKCEITKANIIFQFNMAHSIYKPIRALHRFLNYLPLVWLGSDLSMLVVAAWHLGRLPQYSIDGDHNGMGLDLYTNLSFWGFVLYAFSIPVFLILLFFRLKDKDRFNKYDWVGLAIHVSCLLIPLMFRLLLNDTFNWMMD